MINFKNRKDGSSHVEIIIAFVFFVGFVMFLLYYIKPFESKGLEESSLVALKDRFFERVSANLTIVLGDFSDNGKAPCKPNITGTKDMNAVAINTPKSSEGFYEIWISDASDFGPNNIDKLPNCPPNSYVLGNIRTENVLSELALQEMKEQYTQNYDGLKANLGLSPNADFSVIASGYIFELQKRSPDQINVAAAVYRKPVLNSSATLINRDFIFKVW